MSTNQRIEKEAPARKWINDNESDSEQEVGLVPHNRGYKYILFYKCERRGDMCVLSPRCLIFLDCIFFTNVIYFILNLVLRLLKRWAPSDSQYGGSKLRAPTSLAEETDVINGDKQHTVVKRKRRYLYDDASDEEDPYTLINIEEILSPIETPTDIVQRPALCRILQSGHISALAGTAMEFIEGEKDFNKVLCRLSAILHKDDPQYLDVDLDDTPSSKRADTIDESTADAKDSNDTTTTTMESDVVRHVKELLLENINLSNEYLTRLQGARDKLTKARLQKEALYTELQSQLIAQRRPSRRH